MKKSVVENARGCRLWLRVCLKVEPQTKRQAVVLSCVYRLKRGWLNDEQDVNDICSHTDHSYPTGSVIMKRSLLLCLIGACLSVSVVAQPTTTPWQPQSSPTMVQLTPAAAKCDLSRCQQDCYVSRTHCKNKEGGGCSTEAQMCVQACTNQCR
jgi:hypothetical protein